MFVMACEVAVDVLQPHRWLAAGRLPREPVTRTDWAEEVRRLLDEDYPTRNVTLVCDNLNTHDIASLYHTFDAQTAGRLRRRLRIVHTPKNGSWLNMAEIELSILSRQCLSQRFTSTGKMDASIHTWETTATRPGAGTNWHHHPQRQNQTQNPLSIT
ncbi:MAG: transposase [Planctomycetaceae bacterium]